MEASLLCILMSQQSLYATRRSTSTLESGSPLQQDLSDTLSCVPVRAWIIRSLTSTLKSQQRPVLFAHWLIVACCVQVTLVC